MKKQNLLVLATVVAGLFAPLAHASTFLQYSSNSMANSISFNGTTVSGTAIPVNLTYLDPVNGAPATGTLNFSATANGPASLVFGFYYVLAVDNISFTLTNGTTDILSGTAASGSFNGSDAGFMLSSDKLGVSFVSTLYGPKTGLSFDLNTGTPSNPLSIDSNGVLSSFDTTASPGAFVGSPAPTPEPTSLALLGTGLLGLVAVARRKLSA